MHLQRLFLRGLVLLAVLTAVAAKKGGGGIDLDTSTSSDGDSSSDPEGTSIIGGSSSTSDATCSGTSGVLYKTDLLPINAFNWMSNAPGSNSKSPTTGQRANHRSRLSLGYTEGANMTGSLTNTTLELSIAGEGNVSTPYMPGSLAGENAGATFNITFSGTFDGRNSTRAVAIKQDTQPMEFWVDDGAMMYRPVSWMLKLIFVGWIAWFVSDG